MQFMDYVNAFVWFLIIGNTAAMVVGLIIWIAPAKLPRITAVTDRWVSLRPFGRPLDAVIESDSFTLKHPRVFGAIILLAAVFVLISLIGHFTKTNSVEGGRLLDTLFNWIPMPAPAWEVVWLTVMIILVLGAALAVFVGFTSIFKMSLLMKASEKANQWVSSRQKMKPIEITHDELDSYIRHNPKLWGRIITVTAGFVLLMMIWIMT